MISDVQKKCIVILQYEIQEALEQYTDLNQFKIAEIGGFGKI